MIYVYILEKRAANLILMYNIVNRLLLRYKSAIFENISNYITECYKSAQVLSRKLGGACALEFESILLLTIICSLASTYRRFYITLENSKEEFKSTLETFLNHGSVYGPDGCSNKALFSKKINKSIHI